MAFRFRAEFDADRDFVTKRELKLSGVTVPVGRLLDKTLVPTRRLRQLFDQRALAYPDERGRDICRAPAPRRKAAKPVQVRKKRQRDPRDLIEIPAGWEGLRWPQRLKLAEAFASQRLVTNAQVNQTIEDELARRSS